MDALGITAFDLVALGVIGLSTLFALVRGFVREVLAILTWVGAIVAAWYGFEPLRPYVQDLVPQPMLADGITLAVVFLVPLVALKILSFKLGAVLGRIGFGGIDSVLGAAFGFARGALIVILAYLAIDFFLTEDERPSWVREARVLPYVEQGVEVLRQLVPEEVAERAREAVEGGRRTGEAIADPAPLLAPPGVPEREADEQGYDEEERDLLERLILRRADDEGG